jgi:c-di-GMP-binding flagellar brake protein YcgR
MDQQWQPMPGQVVLVIPEGTDDRYTGIVGSVSDDGIEVTLSHAIDGLEKTGAAAPVEARFVAPSAMYRLSTKAKVTGGTGTRIALSEASKIERVQRRRYPRVSAALPVAVAAYSSDSRTFVAHEGLTIDLSAGGVSLLTTSSLPDGSNVHLGLTLPGGVLDAVARVVEMLEHEGRFQYRLALEHVSGEGLDLLARYVNREAAAAGDVLEPQGAEP